MNDQPGKCLSLRLPDDLMAVPVARSSTIKVQVTGINFAMVRDFDGSNFAIPVRFGVSLLKP